MKQLGSMVSAQLVSITQDRIGGATVLSGMLLRWSICTDRSMPVLSTDLSASHTQLSQVLEVIFTDEKKKKVWGFFL